MQCMRNTLQLHLYLMVGAVLAGCAGPRTTMVDESRVAPAEPKEETAVASKPKPAVEKKVLVGRVLDHEKNPVAGAKVYAVNALVGFISYHGPDEVFVYGGESDRIFFFFKKTKNLSHGQAETNETGDFTIGKLKKGKFHLLAVHPLRGIAVVPHVQQPNVEDPLEIVLAPPTFVEGTLRGTPKLSGYLNCLEEMPWQQKAEETVFQGTSYVIMMDSNGWVNIRISPRVKIEENDKYRVGPLPVGGKWQLELADSVPKRSFRATILSLPVETKLGETARLDFNFDAGEKIAGKIIGPEDKPLADVAVAVAQEKDDFTLQYGALTDQEGRYTIRGVPPGEYKLTALRHAIRKGFG